MDKKLKITRLVMELEKDFHDELKSNQELIFMNKELRDENRDNKKKLEAALDDAWNYCILWTGTTLILLVALLWLGNSDVRFDKYNQFEENTNGGKICGTGLRFQTKWTQPKIHCPNSSLRTNQKFGQGR